MLRRTWPQCEIFFNGDALVTLGGAIELSNPTLSRGKYIEDLIQGKIQIGDSKSSPVGEIEINPSQ